ncbi:lipopolysaccharide transport system ATP-binding protein [Aromatoleum tolulyticum]|uniref:Lipopolysaccharide transport system ATP-binding protein n=1 Tax=Aromatoleum tolulyticum TaxID=34027 RepID=A0A1N6UT76_9RHOO|nr:ABC transporter ATP-binding protein [Aromatoleum tolulyticum]SIQ68838.1 lipopolysaccharide transport system ATP-binding protein [Aromatoleum tolulyticum]
MSSEVVIQVSSLSKCFEIYDQPRDRLKQFVLPRVQRKLGKLPNKYYREFWALRNVSFDVRKGETVGIVGRNGSGKSTLLQMICGTLEASLGTVCTRGKVAALLELGSGFNPEFTGRENVYLNGSVLGLSVDQVSERFESIEAFADIGEFIDQPVKTYSSGMMMRLAFSVIAHVDADILVIDEALAVGDAVFIQKCNLFLKNFIQRGTLLFVSHSMQAVLELCDRAIWLREGEMAADGNAKEVVRHYNAYVHQQINKDAVIQVTASMPSVSDAESNQRVGESLDVAARPAHAYLAKVFAFDFSSAFWGAGGAEIVGIELLDSDKTPVTQLSGGEVITVRICCHAINNLIHPIVGFCVRNQRGVELISENTSLGYMVDLPPYVAANSNFVAEFQFFLPYLPVGEYFIGGAVADRVDGEGHTQHHRRDDALRISVVSSHVVYGVLSMPMTNCTIRLE